MSAPRVAPYGSWPSPVSAESVAVAGVRLGQLETDGEAVLWLEGRPAEGGRNALVRREPGGPARDVTPSVVNVRTRVHEYGGGAFLVAGAWSCSPPGPTSASTARTARRPPRPITPEPAGPPPCATPTGG